MDRWENSRSFLEQLTGSCCFVLCFPALIPGRVPCSHPKEKGSVLAPRLKPPAGFSWAGLIPSPEQFWGRTAPTQQPQSSAHPPPVLHLLWKIAVINAENPLNICLRLVFNPLKNTQQMLLEELRVPGNVPGDAQGTEVPSHQNAAEWVREKQNPSTSPFVLTKV